MILKDKAYSFVYKFPLSVQYCYYEKFICNLFLSKNSILLLCFVMNAIKVDLSLEKISFINYAYQKEIQYWKKAALEKDLTKNEAKEVMDLAPLRVFLIHQAAIKNAKRINIDEIISYLKSKYSADRNQITLIQGIPNQRDVPSFEAISEDLKTLSKSMKENENTSLKNKFLSVASNV